MYVDYESRDELDTQIDLINALCEGGFDEEAHGYHQSNRLNKDEDEVELCEKLLSNLNDPSKEFLDKLLPMLSEHVQTCYNDFKKHVVKGIIE